MTLVAANSISISAAAPPYATNSIKIDRTACGGGLNTAWDHRTYIGDFPPQPVDQGPIWVAPYVDPYPYRSPPVEDTMEKYRRIMDLAKQVAPPPSKFRTRTVGERYLVALDIPGVRKGGVELTIEGYTVTVKGFREDLNETISETIVLTQEYEVDPRKVDAWHEDGVLTVAFKKLGKVPVKIGIR